MKFDKNFILTFLVGYPLILSIPFVRETMGFSLNKYYFPIPFLVVFIIVIVAKLKIRLARQELSNMLIGISLLLMTLIGFSGQLTFPTVFFLVTTISIISFYNLSGTYSPRLIGYIAVIYLVTSVFAFLNPENFQNLGRFSGFTISASVYSTFLTAIYIIYYWVGEGSFKVKLVVFCVFAMFIAFSETRLNLIFFMLLPIIFWLAASKQLKLIALLSFIIVLNLIYPLYSLIAERSNIIATYRYEDGRDASFELRYALYKTVWKEYKSLSVSEKIFGKGSEQARKVIQDYFKVDHMPHQDFIRILYDFGILGLSLFVLFILRKSLRDEVAYSLTYLYFISFFHNMVYNLLIILLILLFAGSRTPASNPVNKLPD
jgi:hypothetical protein